MRKLFLPSVGDTRLPIEEIGKDPWLMLDFAPMQEEHLKPIVLARQDMIKMVVGALIQLKIIANQPVPDAIADEERRKKDSVK